MDLIVVAAVIERDDAFLLSLRPAGTHLEGCWEFPGGKCDPRETHADALRRELHEELDLDARVGGLVHRTLHVYPDRRVELLFYRCEIEGIPKPMVGQEVRWVRRGDLAGLPFPDADAELIGLLTGARARDSRDTRGTAGASDT